MAWPKPPLEPVTRIILFIMEHSWHRFFRPDEARRNRLLIATHDADYRNGKWFMPQRINCGDALPGRGGHKAFAQDVFDGEAWAIPILPSRRFIPIEPWD